MFFTYLRRELRRRARQASIIALGLALGIGLVITVTALSSGVKNAQGEVLHSLYGLDTDITVTKAPTYGSWRRLRFPSAASAADSDAAQGGQKVTIDNLTSDRARHAQRRRCHLGGQGSRTSQPRRAA